MFLVRKDIKQNRLFLTLSGIITVEDALKIKDLIVKEVEDLKPGFDTINDMSKFIRGEDSSAPVLQWIMNHLAEKKVRNIIRIIGPSKTGLMQFAKYSVSGSNLFIKYVPTLKEAEKILNELPAEF